MRWGGDWLGLILSDEFLWGLVFFSAVCFSTQNYLPYIGLFYKFELLNVSLPLLRRASSLATFQHRFLFNGLVIFGVNPIKIRYPNTNLFFSKTNSLMNCSPLKRDSNISPLLWDLKFWDQSTKVPVTNVKVPVTTIFESPWIFQLARDNFEKNGLDNFFPHQNLTKTFWLMMEIIFQQNCTSKMIEKKLKRCKLPPLKDLFKNLN